MLFLVSYVRRGFDYPIGWDSPFYVWRANAVEFDGLARLGTVRSGSPLLLAVLMQATRQNALTLVAVVPAVLAGVVGLGAAVMVRASLEIEARWVPVIGILAWAAFVDIGIMQGHLDNATNVALVMCGLAAAVVLMRGERGAVAAGGLLAAAGVAEWPFYVFAAAILVGALALFVLVTIRTGGEVGGVRGPVGALGIGVVASGVVTGLTFLGIPAVGGVGAAIADPGTRALLRQRFIERLHDTVRYWAFPLAVAGGVVAAKEPVSGSARAARLLFLSVMASWTVMTVVAGIAQWAGAPVAGGRVTSYFFVAPILTGVLVWWLARWAAARIRPRAGAAVAAVTAAAIAIVAVVGFGFAAWDRTRRWEPWMEPEAVAQTAAAGRYLQATAPGSPVIFTFTDSPRISDDTVGRWWNVVKASLPASEVPGASYTQVAPRTVASRAASPLVVVPQRYDPDGYGQAVSLDIARHVAPGVLVLNAPAASTAPPGATPEANTSAGGILLTGALVVAALFVAGLGWALGLLPRDPVTVVGLAPGLGMATIILVALVWEVVGLPLHGLDPLWPLAIAAGFGWAAWWVRGRSAPDPVTSPS